MLYIIGISISFFLSLLFLNKKNKTNADKVLAIWLLVIGLHLILYYLSIVGKTFQYPILLGLSFPFPLLHGPFLFLYCGFLTNQIDFNVKWKIFFHFIPALGTIVYLLFTYYFLSEHLKIEIFKQDGLGFENFMVANNILVNTSGLFYSGWSYFLILKHKRNLLNQFSYTEKINLNWLKYLIIGVAIIWCLVVFGTEEQVFIAATLIVIFIGFFGINQVGIFNNHNGTNHISGVYE